MRAEANQFQAIRVRLPVNQHQGRPDMAIAVILPLTDQRMIAVTLQQRHIGDEKLEGPLSSASSFLPGTPDFSRR
jgi:hypothetical protein